MGPSRRRRVYVCVVCLHMCRWGASVYYVRSSRLCDETKRGVFVTSAFISVCTSLMRAAQGKRILCKFTINAQTQRSNGSGSRESADSVASSSARSAPHKLQTLGDGVRDCGCRTLCALLFKSIYTSNMHIPWLLALRGWVAWYV